MFDREASGLVTMLGPYEGGRIIHGLLVVKEVTHKPGKLRKCLVREAEPEPLSYLSACSSRYSFVWMEAMNMAFDGLMAAVMFAEATDDPEGCNVTDAKWVYKWKGDSYGTIDRAKARMVAMGYSQVERID